MGGGHVPNLLNNYGLSEQNVRAYTWIILPHIIRHCIFTWQPGHYPISHSRLRINGSEAEKLCLQEL